MVKHLPDSTAYALPGGHLETGETLEACLARELLEETGIQAQIGPLLFVNQWINATNHRVEFFFWITNAQAFRQANPTTASHGFEIAELVFADPSDAKYNLLPAFLRTKFSRITELGVAYPTEVITSN